MILTETENYPLSACVSDTGGAAGLFLGLHVIGQIFFSQILTKPFSGVMSSLKKWTKKLFKNVRLSASKKFFKGFRRKFSIV